MTKIPTAAILFIVAIVGLAASMAHGARRISRFAATILVLEALLLLLGALVLVAGLWTEPRNQDIILDIGGGRLANTRIRLADAPIECMKENHKIVDLYLVSDEFRSFFLSERIVASSSTASAAIPVRAKASRRAPCSPASAVNSSSA